MGIHVLRTGRFEFNLPLLTSEVERMIGWESEVLPHCRRDRDLMDPALLDLAWDEYDRLNKELDAAYEGSELPADYDGWEKLNRMLLKWRSAGWR